MSASFVVDFVSRARWRRQWRSAVESSALGIAAAMIALAACRWSQGLDSPSGSHAGSLAACAALSGLAMAATWWVERAKKSDLDLALQIDTRLERDGALAATFEARRRGEEGALIGLLEERLAATLDQRSLRRALPPPGFVWLAPPALAAALLALSLELPERRELPDGSPAGALQPAGAPLSNAAAKAVLERARTGRGATRDDPERRARLLAELDEALSRLPEAGSAASEDSATAAAEAALREELLAERNALAGAASAAPRASSDVPGRSGGDSTGAGAGTPPEGDKSLLTNGSPDRTMSGSNRPTAGANAARTATQAPETGNAGEAGTLAGRWWDERYDPVVQGWRRALAERKEQH